MAVFFPSPYITSPTFAAPGAGGFTGCLLFGAQFFLFVFFSPIQKGRALLGSRAGFEQRIQHPTVRREGEKKRRGSDFCMMVDQHPNTASCYGAYLTCLFRLWAVSSKRVSRSNSRLGGGEMSFPYNEALSHQGLFCGQVKITLYLFATMARTCLQIECEAALVELPLIKLTK